MRETGPYAARAERSRGRAHPEDAAQGRNEFQRDRDRIVHSTAFRRLEYKTQVFVNHEGDLYRTRLTHSLEVAQIARAVARALRVDEDLTEAIALAHDLGHTPFGHAGQDALNACMRGHGGWHHHKMHRMHRFSLAGLALSPIVNGILGATSIRAVFLLDTVGLIALAVAVSRLMIAAPLLDATAPSTEEL